MPRTFDEVLREAFTAGFDSHVYDPSDRSLAERYTQWRAGLSENEETSPMPESSTADTT